MTGQKFLTSSRRRTERCFAAGGEVISVSPLCPYRGISPVGGEVRVLESAWADSRIASVLGCAGEAGGLFVRFAAGFDAYAEGAVG